MRARGVKSVRRGEREREKERKSVHKGERQQYTFY